MSRLVASGDSHGTLCYVVAGDLDRVVNTWLEGRGVDSTATTAELQDLVEVVMMVRAAVEASGASTGLAAGGRLAASLSQYASLLAAQGSLGTALTYLGDTTGDQQLTDLKERLEKCLRLALSYRPSSYSLTGAENM